MSTPAGVVGGLLGSAASEAAAFAAGLAIGPTLSPVVRFLENEAWAEAQTRPLDAGDVATAEAQGYTGANADGAEATLTGLNSDRLAVLAYIASVAPGTAELLELWRRDKIGPDLVRAGLKKSGLREEYIEPVMELFDNPLDPAVIATAIQRGIMVDPGFLPVGPPTATGKVPAFPVSPLDPLEEAKWSGISKERLFVETALVGLPLSLQQAASAYFRQIIELADFERAVSEGNTRNEWGDAALEQARQIPSATDFVQERLRGWTDDAGMYAGTAKHGMSAADTDILFKIHGRPLSWHQVFIGLRRGGVYDGPTTDIAPAFLTALKQSDVRPEWYNLAWAQRFNYPTAFVLRALTEAHDITQQRSEEILLFEGWEPELAKQVSTKWYGTTSTAADSHVGKAQTQLWTTTHASYKAEEIDGPAATSALTAAGVEPGSIPAVRALWDAERALIRAQLTPKQIVKALGEGVTNPATGQPWTVADATAALMARGYSQADATVLIQE